MKVKLEDEHLFKQVFIAAVMVLLLATFYMLVASSSAASIEKTITPMMLIVLAIIGLAIMSELSRLGCMLSKRK